MSDERERPNPTAGAGALPPAPPLPDAVADAGLGALLRGKAEPSDDTPTIITKVPPRPNGSNNLFSGILRGRKLAHFELIEPIGVGGMAAVLRARDTQLERFVALKILPPEMAADPENVARFHQEARAAARLDHETIARVFYCGEDQSLHFIAFEFVEGENLRTLIDRRGALPVPEALHYMLQVATGLAHAAERGVVHRDIKPSNIIISPNGRAKLVDMGLARNLDPHTDNGLTQSGVTLGTFDYISPEQALEPRDADVRSDIYSLGCTFYHVLTGQAPVPEGTAARKLHHHQHVPPIDPRQLNADIPDEVAAILGRMMAKDPRQRYQRPEHLVQHLLQATQRLGGAADGPDGVLFVDAALPAPPQSRPLLVIGCCMAIVTVLVLLVGPSRDVRNPPSRQAADTNQPAEAQPPPAGPPGVEAAPGGGERPKPVAPVAAKTETLRKEIDSYKALAEFAATTTSDESYDIVLTRDLWPPEVGTPEGAAAIRLLGKRISLSGADVPAPTTLWTRYVAVQGREWGLNIEADTIEVNHLRLVADANYNTPPQEAAGLRCRAAREVSVRDCEFLQGNWPEPSAFSSVALRTPLASFERCCFLGGKDVNHPAGAAASGGWLNRVSDGGQTAVALLGPSQVSAQNCAFGPHAALFRFEKGDRPPAPSRLSLRRCTALAGNEWALAALGDSTSATLTAAYCLFGRLNAAELPAQDGMGMAMMNERKLTTCLFRVAPGATLPLGWYLNGEHNRYLGIDAVRLPLGDDPGAADVPFDRQLLALGGTDDKSLPPTAVPWRDKAPLLLLQGSLKPQDLLAAFRLDFNNVPGLNITDPKAAPPTAIVGMMDSPWGGAEWKPEEIASAPVKVVDPKKATDTAKGVYGSLGEALAGAKTGDVIAIRHNGELPIEPITLLKSGVSVTIRAEEGSRPVLALGKDTPDAQAALFRVHTGQLTLEGLDFVLQPKSGFESQAVALLFGEGSVLMKHCVVTLSGRQVPLAAVAMADPKGAMAMPGATGAPRVAFEACFVRGEGDLVAARTSRPFDLDVTDSLAALTGSLLSIDAGTKESPAPLRPEIAVRLNQVTAYLGGYLVRAHAASLDSLVPVACTPVKSLLVSADRRALLRLEAGPKDAKAARERLLLRDGERNQYANFSPLLEQQATDNETPAVVETQERWRDKENGETRFDSVKFAGAVWPDAPPADASPKDFELTTGPADRGASPQKLPRPAER
jgi:serine/threonine protein kinase